MSVTWRPSPWNIGGFRINRSSNGMPVSVSMKVMGISFILWSRKRAAGVSYINGPGDLNFQVNKGKTKGEQGVSRRTTDTAPVQRTAAPRRRSGALGRAVKRMSVAGILGMTAVGVVYDVPGSITAIIGM